MTAMSNIHPPLIGCRSEDITTNTTMTVMEMKKKRAYKRKHCGGDTTDCGGDTSTSTVVEKKKRVYRRKDCVGKNTSTVMETKRRAYRRKDCVGKNTPTVTEKKKRAYRSKKCLPHDLIVEEILTRLSVPTLLLNSPKLSLVF
ncbi:hypothetical protein MKW92_051260 [Papaver armeniacum]|nr:hypothetical protein MKW92_051260 [Papaver armeniacum]